MPATVSMHEANQDHHTTTLSDKFINTTLTPQITGKSQCINFISHWLWNVRYKIYRTLSLISASQKLLQCFDAGNETTTLLYRCMNAISIVGFSSLNFILCCVFVVSCFCTLLAFYVYCTTLVVGQHPC